MSMYIYIMYYFIEMCTRTSCRRSWHFDWGLDTLMTCTRLHSVGRLLDSWTMGTSSVNIGNEKEQTWFQLTSLRQGQMRFSNQSWLTYSLSPLRQTFPFFSNSHRDFLSLLSREFLGSVKTSTGNLKEHLISEACYFYILIMPCCCVGLFCTQWCCHDPFWNRHQSDLTRNRTSCKLEAGHSDLPSWPDCTERGWVWGDDLHLGAWRGTFRNPHDCPRNI